MFYLLYGHLQFCGLSFVQPKQISLKSVLKQQQYKGREFIDIPLASVTYGKYATRIISDIFDIFEVAKNLKTVFFLLAVFQNPIRNMADPLSMLACCGSTMFNLNMYTTHCLENRAGFFSRTFSSDLIFLLVKTGFDLFPTLSDKSNQPTAFL